MSLRHAPWAEGHDFSIGLKPIAPEHWLEGGEADPTARKDALLAAHRDLVWGETADSRAGQAEIADLLGVAAADDQPPLLAAARTVADDLILMEKTDGDWRVTALSLSAPTFFTAAEVLGKSLAELHGPVHGFAERFLVRVRRIFDGLRPELILERRNWTIVNSGESFTPHSAPVRAQIPDLRTETAGRDLFIRVERQTLRRLPRTGGALFTIRVWLDPLDSLTKDPERLAAFARAWREAPADFKAYKGFSLYAPLVEGFLRAHGETHSVNGT
ncbi:heme-dependent oxidative N-demethylase subunit alpha family protein [Phenylobacterium aquaticum]|uniref:heme-dependent oxidative N-demethylase subunit alpha family protein n=1 Tax=Phenylobacterium aquaticum TaxID=1763816 RepID=UPI0026F2CE13|nr:heme-dependent oxidative N-demethylase subunit alpha family protein [Phenylobacterium aquaticum]